MAFPDVVIHRGCRLTNVVLDKQCVLPPGTVIGEDAEEDARRFYRSENGVVLVTRNMLKALGLVVPAEEALAARLDRPS